MFVQCLEQVQHYTCHILLFSLLLIKHHLHSMLCYFIISQGVTVAPLFPPRSTFLQAASGMLQGWIAVGRTGGFAKEHGNAQDFALHSFTALWKKKMGKRGKWREIDPKDPTQGAGACSGSHEGNSCRSHHGCVSVAQVVEGNLIPPNPAVSDTVPLRDPTALPKHQHISGTRSGTTGRSEGH